MKKPSLARKANNESRPINPEVSLKDKERHSKDKTTHGNFKTLRIKDTDFTGSRSGWKVGQSHFS